MNEEVIAIIKKVNKDFNDIIAEAPKGSPAKLLYEKIGRSTREAVLEIILNAIRDLHEDLDLKEAFRYIRYGLLESLYYSVDHCNSMLYPDVSGREVLRMTNEMIQTYLFFIRENAKLEEV